MKTMIHMNMSEKDNFDEAVEGYINNNLSFIREATNSTDADELAKASLEHYNSSVEASEQNDEQLSDEQKEVFLATAKRFFAQQ
jgi:hypothetical protein